jgi:hypothetical protein
MKIFCGLFFVLVVMSLNAFAQNEQRTEPPEMRKASTLEEFGKVPSGQIRLYLDNFFGELQNNPTAQGYIFNYGAKRDVARREKLFRDHVVFRKVNPSQITFVRGKYEIELRTQLWVIPEGNEMPKP